MEKPLLHLWEEYCESAHAKSISSPYIEVSQELSKKIKEINGRTRERNRSLLRSGNGPDISNFHKNNDTD
jgi:hypothetical protein